MAGGAATAYYTTYAAHFVRQLRVIESPLVGGLLLLAVAGVFLLVEQIDASCKRRPSSAFYFPYYTSAINPPRKVPPCSSVLLTVVARVLLLALIELDDVHGRVWWGPTARIRTG